MKHAIITDIPVNDRRGEPIEALLADGRRVFLAEGEYTEAELEAFRREKDKWIIRCSGERQFLADSDSGEDATGRYCGFFDLIPERAVFADGKLVGVYLCSDGMRYSGRGRDSFDIDQWGWPGNDPFVFRTRGAKILLFLFDDAANREAGDWALLERKEGEDYSFRLEF